MRVIGLRGNAGADMDTAARFLADGFGYVILSFAAPLYAEISAAFGMSVESLQARPTKETPQTRLAVVNCLNMDFVSTMLANQRAAERLRGYTGCSTREFLLEPRSPRWVLQRWGTEFRCESVYGHTNYWVNQLLARVLEAPTRRFVVRDVLRPNEAEVVRWLGGVLVYVRRPALDEQIHLAREEGCPTATHSSVTALDGVRSDYEVVTEEGRPESLQKQLEQLFTREAFVA